MNKKARKYSSVILFLILLLSVQPLAQARHRHTIFYCQTSTYSGSELYTRIDGTVYLRKDGKEYPVADALVEIYMTTLYKKRFESRTGKSGFYTQNGILRNAEYVVIVSGPGLEPAWVHPVEPFRKNTVNVYVRPGDGSRLTFDQAMLAIYKSAIRSDNVPWGDLPRVRTGLFELSIINIEDSIKEYQLQALTEPDPQVLKNLNEAGKEYKQGIDALKTEKYEEAGVAFEKAAAIISASAHPVFAELVIKANASAADSHYQLAVTLFNNKKRDEAKPRFERAVAAISRAIKAAQPLPDMNSLLFACYDIFSRNVLILVEHFGVTDSAADALKAIDNAQAIDVTDKNRWATTKGRLLVLLGRPDEAADLFKKVLTADPKNIDSLYGMSLILGVSEDKQKLQEAAQYMTAFIGAAPATDGRVREVKTLLEAIQLQIGARAEPSSKNKKP